MKNLVEKIKHTTLKQRVATGAIILLLVGGGTGLAVNKHNKSVLADSQEKLVKAEKKADDEAEKARVKQANKAYLVKVTELKVRREKTEAEQQAKIKAENEAKQKADDEAKAKVEAEKVQAEQAQALAEQQAQAQIQAVAEQQNSYVNQAQEVDTVQSSSNNGGGTGAYIAPDGHEYEVPSNARPISELSQAAKDVLGIK